VELGVNDKGQLGDGTKKPREKPVRVEGLNNIVAIAAGVTHVLALDVGGNVWAWGFNTTGQLGDGTVKSRPTPGLVHNLDRVIAIAAGGAHSLALRADGTVRAWGWNNKGSSATAPPPSRSCRFRCQCSAEWWRLPPGASTAWHCIIQGWCGHGVPTGSVRSATTQPRPASPTRPRLWTARAAPTHSI